MALSRALLKADAVGDAREVTDEALDWAESNADAVVIAPFDYTAIIWATILGYLLFGDLPGLPVVIGCGVIVASGIYIIYRENQVRRAGLRS